MCISYFWRPISSTLIICLDWPCFAFFEEKDFLTFWNRTHTQVYMVWILYYWESLILWINAWCANTHNCLGPTLGSWWNTKVSLNISSSASLKCSHLGFSLSHRPQRSEDFSLLTHTKWLLSVTFYDTTSGIGSLTWQMVIGRVERREGWNSYVDFLVLR